MVKSNAEMMAEEQKKAQEAMSEFESSPLSDLARHLHAVWDDALLSKEDVEDIMLWR